MDTPNESTTPRSVHNIALAYFVTRENVSDATRDLCNAGFIGNQINITHTPTRAEAVDPATHHQPLPNAIGPHSLRWILNRARTHDRQRQGANQMHGLDPVPKEPANPTCWTLDLASALNALAIPTDVIALLQRDTADTGMFMLIDAPDRVPEASSILSGNAGFLRTQYLRSPQA